MGVTAHDIMLEVDGEGLHPTTVPSLEFMRLATAYLELMAAVASKLKLKIVWTGAVSVDKCAAIRWTPSNYRAAAKVARESVALVSGTREREGVTTHVRGVREAVRALPKDASAQVRAGRSKPMGFVVRAEATAEAGSLEITTLRVIVEGVGNAKAPQLTLRSFDEEKLFHVTASVEDAKRAGRAMFDEIEADLEIARDDTGSIVGGRLLSFEPLISAENEADVLQDWLDRNVTH